jgi:hypothetical protein
MPVVGDGLSVQSVKDFASMALAGLVCTPSLKPGPGAGPVRAVAQQHGALLCDGRARPAAGREQGQRARARRLRLHGGHLAVPGGGRQEGGQGRRQKPAGEIILAQSFISQAASVRVRLFYFSPANNFVKKKNKFRLPQNFQWRFCPHD